MSYKPNHTLRNLLKCVELISLQYFTKICNQQHYIILEYFNNPKKKYYVHKQPQSIPFRLCP